MAITSHLSSKTGVEAVVDVVSAYQVQVAPDGLEFGSPDDMSAWIFGGITVPPRLWEFLLDIRLLRRIPLSYLVPDPKLLPPESIRFFHVNQTWVDRVIDGVFSTTNVGTVDFHYSLTMLQLLREAIDPAPNGMTGLLIRSELVRRWPKMVVRAFDALEVDEDAESTVEVLRAEALSRDIFIALFAGQPKRVHILEPFQGVRYGVEGTQFPYQVDQRNDNGEIGNAAIPVTARNVARRTLDIQQLGGNPAIPVSMRNARGVALLLEQRPFVQIFKDDVSESEGSQPAPANLLVPLRNGKSFTLNFVSQALFQLDD